MPTKEQFLASIRSDPRDRALQLVYADWLEEQGETELAQLRRIAVHHGLPLFRIIQDKISVTDFYGGGPPVEMDGICRGEIRFMAWHRPCHFGESIAMVVIDRDGVIWRVPSAMLTHNDLVQTWVFESNGPVEMLG